jgi:hypothetical protein
MTEQRAALTAEQVRELLDYDPETGRFTWRIAPRGHKAGSQAGCIDSYGYVVIRIAGAGHKAHRLAWLIAYGEWPDDQIDHINGERSDNRIANLRSLTNQGNQQNRRTAHRGNSSGLLGVSPKRGKWRAQIKVDGEKRHIGMFDTPEAAHAAYLEAKRKLHPTCSI